MKSDRIQQKSQNARIGVSKVLFKRASDLSAGQITGLEIIELVNAEYR
jgi:hypothetical protein